MLLYYNMQAILMSRSTQDDRVNQEISSIHTED